MRLQSPGVHRKYYFQTGYENKSEHSFYKIQLESNVAQIGSFLIDFCKKKHQLYRYRALTDWILDGE